MTTTTETLSIHIPTEDWNGVSDPTARCGQWLDAQYSLSWLDAYDHETGLGNGRYDAEADEHITDMVEYLYSPDPSRYDLPGYVSICEQCII